MKSNAEFTKDIIQQVKAKRKKKRIKLSSITLCVCAFLCFVVGYSNIITFDFSARKNYYMEYLAPYISKEEDVGFRFVDKQSAVVHLSNKVYPCAYRADSSNDFTLNVVQNTEEEEFVIAEQTQENEPSVFRLEFWDTSAKLSWEINGVKIEKILSVTDEKSIPAGLWALCATQNGDDGNIVEKENGAGWTLILEDGTSYTGEGASSAWKTKFVSVGNTLFQCLFDPISGIILDASEFVYDETTFEYPVIKERYLSDGDPYYFYSRLLSDEEKIDFTKGSFTAAVVKQEIEIQPLAKEKIFDESLADWQLFPKKTQELTDLSLTAKLHLNEDGSVTLKISGDGDYNGTFKGKWYALKHSVLIVLDKKSALVGQVFTVYAPNSAEGASGEFIQKYGQSYIESYDCYKLGYHTFDYYASKMTAQIYWGKEWTPDKLKPELKYETEYVLYGAYNDKYFNQDPDAFDRKTFTEDDLVDLPINGQVTVVFHTDGTATATFASGEVKQGKYELGNGNDWIKFPVPIEIYRGKYAVGANPWYPDNVDEDRIVRLGGARLEIDFNNLYCENGYAWSYSYPDENGKWIQENYYVVYYRFYLQPKLD